MMAAKSSQFFNTYGKVLSLFSMMILGALIPQAYEFSFLIQYLLMVMLFFAFLDINLRPQAFPKSVIWILLANTAVAFLGYRLFASHNLTFALVAFMTGIAPSAIASPVVIGFIQGQVEYAVAAVLLTNLSSAVIVPLALPSLMGSAIPISILDVLQTAFILIFVPLILAQLVTRLPQNARAIVRKGKRFSFVLWLASLFLVSAKASDFIRSENISSVSVLVDIALIALGVCVINFSLGAWIGGTQFRREASQALGQKNLGYVIWIALTFINPLVAIGPMFYIVYHHLYNSWLIYRFEKQRSRV
ncbi:MAG: bile acid:sodium symporter family protein [Anaerolineales bacterium]